MLVYDIVFINLGSIDQILFPSLSGIGTVNIRLLSRGRVFLRFLSEVGHAPPRLQKKQALVSEINDLWRGHAYFSNFSERHSHRVSKAVFILPL